MNSPVNNIPYPGTSQTPRRYNAKTLSPSSSNIFQEAKQKRLVNRTLGATASRLTQLRATRSILTLASQRLGLPRYRLTHAAYATPACQFRRRTCTTPCLQRTDRTDDSRHSSLWCWWIRRSIERERALSLLHGRAVCRLWGRLAEKAKQSITLIRVNRLTAVK